METTRKIVWQVWALIGVVFVLGCLTGASVSTFYNFRRGGPDGTGSNGPRRGMIEKIKQDLNLSEAQTTQIQAIFEDSRKEFRALSETCPQIKDGREKTSARIRALLTPEQQQKFDEIKARREKERNR